ncbi:MAG: MFS transporter [Rhodobacterales bacterium]|nr:MAG: MFS transporter [Rhodobacterales bacterium]
MTNISAKKRIWGWMMFDWASQPYNTVLLTFVFGPYFAEMVTDLMLAQGMAAPQAKAKAQEYWGWGLAIAGIVIGVLAPVLGAYADRSGRRMGWIKLFSLCYVLGASGLWWTAPDQFSIFWALALFGLGYVGMEFATIFTNSMLPSLVERDQVGKISGSGFALGYWGGLLALAIVLLLFVDNAAGVTLLGAPPFLGLDGMAREGTRFAGPLTALWFILGMIPFFLWVRETPQGVKTGGLTDALAELRQTVKSLPQRPSLFSFLSSSLFYRDALNGLYSFGAIYAVGVLDWSITMVGIFGVVSVITAAIFAYLGGRIDHITGPKPVIIGSILLLLVVCFIVALMNRQGILGLSFAPGSSLPDVIFFICGGVIGAAGGILQASSRSMMVRHTTPEHSSEAFGLYGMSGKATAFLAPALIASATHFSGSQRIGIMPLILLFAIGLFLLRWVQAEGEQDIT